VIQALPGNVQIDVNNCGKAWCFVSWGEKFGYIPVSAVAALPEGQAPGAGYPPGYVPPYYGPYPYDGYGYGGYGDDYAGGVPAAYSALTYPSSYQRIYQVPPAVCQPAAHTSYVPATTYQANQHIIYLPAQ